MKCTLDNLARDLALKGYAQNTQKRYLLRARKLTERFGRPPEQLTQEELRTYIDELRAEPRLRVSEAIALECRDIDGSRGVLYIRHGKGDVAREVKLSNELYMMLRQYWAQVRPVGPYVFASKTGRLPHQVSIRAALRKAAESAGIKKPVHPHVLRHSFATHLLEQGIDSHVVSALLGHKSFYSTQRYARVTRAIIQRTPSPLDLLPHRRR